MTTLLGCLVNRSCVIITLKTLSEIVHIGLVRVVNGKIIMKICRRARRWRKAYEKQFWNNYDYSINSTFREFCRDVT